MFRGPTIVNQLQLVLNKVHFVNVAFCICKSFILDEELQRENVSHDRKKESEKGTLQTVNVLDLTFVTISYLNAVMGMLSYVLGLIKAA